MVTPTAGRVRDARAAFRANRMKARRKRIVRIAIVIMVILLMGAVVWAIWFSSLFIARSVEVAGNSQVTRSEIISAADVPLGTPLAKLDTQAIKANVLAISAIADVSVEREISGVVRLNTTEHTPVYVIESESQYLLVNKEGVGYLVVPAAPAGLLIVNLIPGDTDESRRLMADAAVIIAALPELVLTSMTNLSAETPDTFTITLNRGAEILWGSCEDSDLKAQVIQGLLKIKASYYDVSSPSHPVTR